LNDLLWVFNDDGVFEVHSLIKSDCVSVLLHLKPYQLHLDKPYRLYFEKPYRLHFEKYAAGVG